VSPPLDLDAIDRELKSTPEPGQAMVKLALLATHLPALLTRLEEAEELARALEAISRGFPGGVWVGETARAALARWRGEGDLT
jgi:hypothetical protein